MQIDGKQYLSVWFENERVKMIDQNKLPFEFRIAEYSNYLEICDAIREMTVRGAPAIGATGAYAIALAAQNAPEEKFRAYLRTARDELIATRPTAIDLRNGVNYVYEQIGQKLPHCSINGIKNDYVWAQRIQNEELHICSFRSCTF